MRGEAVRGGFPEPGFYSLPGIERAQAIRRGLVPRAPLAHLTGLSVTQIGQGTATLTSPASPWLDVGDGLDIQFLAEAGISTAVLTGAPGGADVRTAALSFTQFRSATLEADKLIAHARTIRDAPTFTYAEAVIEDDLGREIARVIGAVVVRARDPLPPAAMPPERPFEAPVYPTRDPYLRPLPPGVETISREDWEQHDGLTLMRMYTGAERSAPINALFGLRALDVEQGFVRGAMCASEWLCLHHREVAAGAVATFGYRALTAASITLGHRGTRLGIINLSVRLLRPIAPDGRELVVEAKVSDHQGDSVVATATVTDADGQRVATAYQTSVLLPVRSRPAVRPEPVIATVLFTDLVGSTALAQGLGDHQWRELLTEHESVVRRHIGAFRGREIKTTGDGFLATFDSPARAVRCALAIRESTKRLGMHLRAGIHTGECELARGDVTGIAVHLAARVLAVAAAGEVVVSSTVRDLLLGSDLRFEDRGHHKLKGIEGEWALFAVSE